MTIRPPAFLLLLLSTLLFCGCSLRLQPSSCPLATSLPIYYPRDTWEYRTTTGNTVTERVHWIDERDTYFDWQTTAGPVSAGLTAIQADNVHIASLGDFVTSSQNSLPFPLFPGQEWSYDQLAYRRSGGPGYLETHRRQVITCEWIPTPAGTFNALKILDTRTVPADPPASYMAWYAPEIKTFVKRQHIQGAPPPISATEDDLELLRYTPGAPSASP